MSHLDPYGTEPRGWDRPERPSALPWPERDADPRSRQSASELYAGPQARRRTQERRLDGPDAGPYEPSRDDRGVPYGPRDGRPVPPPGGMRDRARGGGHGDDPSGSPAGALSTGPVGRPYTGGGPARPSPDDTPTSQLAPVRDDDASTVQIPPVTAEADEEPRRQPARRSPGKRRASAERPPTQPAASRAGRNLPAAIGVGLALGALILVPLFSYRPAFLVVVAAAVGVGIWEMVRAVRRSDAHPPLVPLVAGGVLTVVLAWFAGPDALSLGLLVTVLGTMIWRLGDGPAGFQRDITAATLIAVYVPFLGGFAALLAAVPADGHLRVLVTVVAVVLSDTGGYAAGVAFGRHPMAPSISPKKSWEGFAGSVTAAAAGSAVLVWQLLDVSPWWGALFGLAVSGAAVLGDLAESMIKRDLGVKDMSTLLPGHGGLMDRLDSILFAVPTAYLLLAVFVPVVG
ncbi:phosphatidate cytidylyltransferase [Micromonospora sp. KC723]|uniref:phosphatidate cytidylyltransferase n=1 Tax=Micromonospora sp. KC723 TaxID=2530381 RepID=UPI00104A946F|nr:phosphatidate cytidylyltransferase [Micromonospora sp. KC723]TDB71901.1 phosphatidate cytidylyltransferase [Micromonospora sp. KC723]